MGILLSSTPGKLIYNTGSQSINLTSGTNFAVGQRVDLIRKDAGTFEVAGSGSATVTGAPGLKLRAQWSAASIICIAANQYVIVGDLAP
jgi:hypothetical protein